MTGKLYTIGYLAPDAQVKLDELLTDPKTYLVDIRYNAVSRKPGWSGAALRKKYGTRYHPLSGLGNKNYKRPGEPIEISMPDLISVVVDPLQRGFNFILLCACRDYETCHRKTVVELIQAQLPEVEVSV
jgi:hypothetical protein